jgi:hypothetical protein
MTVLAARVLREAFELVAGVGAWFAWPRIIDKIWMFVSWNQVYGSRWEKIERLRITARVVSSVHSSALLVLNFTLCLATLVQLM